MPGPDATRLRRWAAVLSFRTISGKLIIGLVVLFGLASVVVSVVTAQSLNDSLMSSLRTQVQSATSTWFMCASPDNHSPAGDPDHDQQSPPGCYASGQCSGTFLAILSSSGKVEQYHYVGGSCTLTAADQAMLANLPAPDPPGSDLPHGPPPDPQTFNRTLSSLGIEFMFTKVPGPNNTMLVTGLPLTTVNEQLEHVENTEHILFAVALGLAVILGAGLVQFSLRPLRRVAATATRVTELPLDSGEVTLPAGVPDIDPRTEVGQVGAAFNRMLFHVERALSRRAASEARLRRFAADASHELRTPLSAIRGYAELALRHPGPVPEDVTHALARVQSESARMSVLVDDLLLLARLDAGRPLEREPVDLSRLDGERGAARPGGSRGRLAGGAGRRAGDRHGGAGRAAGRTAGRAQHHRRRTRHPARTAPRAVRAVHPGRYVAGSRSRRGGQEHRAGPGHRGRGGGRARRQHHRDQPARPDPVRHLPAAAARACGHGRHSGLRVC